MYKSPKIKCVVDYKICLVGIHVINTCVIFNTILTLTTFFLDNGCEECLAFWIASRNIVNF